MKIRWSALVQPPPRNTRRAMPTNVQPLFLHAGQVAVVTGFIIHNRLRFFTRDYLGEGGHLGGGEWLVLVRAVMFAA